MVLTARDLPFERKHDIDYLCGLIEDAGFDPAPDLSAAVVLTPWSVEFRYPDPFDAPPFDRAEALETVVAVREWGPCCLLGTKQATEAASDPVSEASTPDE